MAEVVAFHSNFKSCRISPSVKVWNSPAVRSTTVSPERWRNSPFGLANIVKFRDVELLMRRIWVSGTNSRSLRSGLRAPDPLLSFLLRPPAERASDVTRLSELQPNTRGHHPTQGWTFHLILTLQIIPVDCCWWERLDFSAAGWYVWVRYKLAAAADWAGGQWT